MDEVSRSDVVTGVGVAALGAAATRALETERADALARDPYAAAFVTSARAHTTEPMPVTWAELDALFPPAGRPDTAAGLATAWWPVMADYAGVRTRFFDEYVLDACAADVRQVVLLAAGLDTRAYRLAWPDGAVVYEVDQPGMLEFKDDVLGEQRVVAVCGRHAVPADLREPWSPELLAAGLDPERPVAWLAEDLLPYLTDTAHAELLAAVDTLSGPGSWFAAEDVDPALWHSASGGGFGANVAGFFADEEKLTPEHRLTARHWQVTVRDAPEVADHYGRHLTGAAREVVGHCRLLTAQRS